MLLSVAVSETFLRMVLREEEANGNYWGKGAFVSFEPFGYRHKPGFKGRAYRRGDFDCPVEISELGLRQKNVQAQLRFPNRLLILGDSFAFGLGVREEETFASLIQECLNPLGIGVINAAQTGYSPKQEIGFAHSLMKDVSPHVILLWLFLDNDIEGDYRDLYMSRNIEVKDGYRLARDRWFAGGLIDFLRTRSYLWMFTESRIKRLGIFRKEHFRFRNLAKANPAEVIGPTLDALRAFSQYCESRDIRFGIVLLPHHEKGAVFYDPVLGALESIGLPFLNLQDGKFVEGDYFDLDGHWNADGHRKAAARVVPFVRELSSERSE